MFLQSIIYLGAFIFSLAGVELFRRWSLRREILDVPNERSLHSKPVPRGGGIVIVFTCLAFYLVAGKFFGGRISWFYFAGAVLIAFISWLDDLYTISIFPRLLIQTVAALLIIFGIAGGFESFSTGAEAFKIIEWILVFVWIVWMTNAYNFMDGIDGLAGLQALIVGVGWSVSGMLLGDSTVEMFAAVIAASSLGFLILNWQPAKVFMGDVGSAFLGYTFACLPFLAAGSEGRPEGNYFLIAVAVTWLFLFDTVFTFIRRLLNGEKFWQPHRKHIYQQMSSYGLSHRAISSLYGFASILAAAAVCLNLPSGGYDKIIYLLLMLESAGLLFLLKNFERKSKRLKV